MLVYGGGIMVLFLFVIMLVNPRTAAETRQVLFGSQWRRGAPALPDPAHRRSPTSLWTDKLPDIPAEPRRLPRWSAGEIAGNSEAVAWSLFRDYLLPFEIASVFLLVAMIGAVVLGKASARRGGDDEHDAGDDEITINHYLIVSSFLLFAIGLFGVLARRNMITVLMSIELMLNAVNLNLIAFSYRLSDLTGPGLRGLHDHDRGRRGGGRPGVDHLALPSAQDAERRRSRHDARLRG